MDVSRPPTPAPEPTPSNHNRFQRPPKSQSTLSTPSRSKRSTTNLSNLRLAPLSTKFSEVSDDYPSNSRKSANQPSSESHALTFQTSHPSYLKGKSAPPTPGILSRSSSRRRLAGGGLSRRGSIYDTNNENFLAVAGDQYNYAGVVREESGAVRVEIGSGGAARLPKAKSEAALLVRRNRSAGRKGRVGGEGGFKKMKSRVEMEISDDDWITRTGAATNALCQESKGMSWVGSRESAVSLRGLRDSTDEEEEDEGYEEMAALSSRTGSRRVEEEQLSPVSTRASRWGSRYGSRAASRRASRRGSVSVATTGSRTPMAGGQDGAGLYLDEQAPSTLLSSLEPDFVDADEETERRHEQAFALLAEKGSFGLGSLVDRLMNFSLFKVEEREEGTEDEGQRDAGETAAQAGERMAKERRRKREEKERLVKAAAAEEGSSQGVEDGEEGEAGWKDAAWLLSVASKAIF